MSNTTAKIYDKQGNPILPDPETDDTMVGVEQITGLNLQALQRIQMNFQVMRDTLFSHLQHEFIITPLTFVRRESILSHDQVHLILGDIFTAQKVKLFITIVLVVVAVLLAALAIWMIRKSKQLRRIESLGLTEYHPIVPLREQGSENNVSPRGLTRNKI